MGCSLCPNYVSEHVFTDQDDYSHEDSSFNEVIFGVHGSACGDSCPSTWLKTNIEKNDLDTMPLLSTAFLPVTSVSIS